MIEINENGNSISFEVRVIPRSSKSGIAGELGGALKVKLSSPPVEGAANKELIKLLAKTLKVSKNSVQIVSGETSKTKRIEIEGIGREKLKKLITGS